jgi:hypothetical protein
MAGWLVNNELEGMLKEVVVAKCNVLSRRLPAATEEIHEQRRSGMVNFWGKIWTGDLSNTK